MGIYIKKWLNPNPDEFLISVDQAYFSLSLIQISKAAGPNNIPNRLLKDFALELAPLVCDIYNRSVREGYTPSLWNHPLFRLSLKWSPPGSIEKGLYHLSAELQRLWNVLPAVDVYPRWTARSIPVSTLARATLQPMPLYICFKRPTKRLTVARRLRGFSLPTSLKVWSDWSLDIDAGTCQSRSFILHS